MGSRSFHALAVLGWWFLVTFAARAGDAAFTALVAQKQWEPAAAEARARLAANPDDLVAAADLALVIVESKRRDQLEEAVALLDRVIAQSPEVAHPHFLLGQALGLQANQAGLRGLKLAGRAERALTRAVELAPANFTYVFALNEFYLEAPGIAGGSASRARAQAEAFAVHDEAGAALLRAQVLIDGKKLAEARELIAGVPRQGIAEHDVVRRTLLTRIGFALLAREQATEALDVFTTVSTEFPHNAAAQLGLGRAQCSLLDLDRGLATLTRARELEDNAEVWYWIGRAQEARGESAAALTSYRGSLDRRSSGGNAADARRRLAALEE